MNDLDEGEIALLAKLADGATLRSVATALGLPRSTVSERLQGLEEKLGQRVFVRQGRRLVPTRLGTILLERAVRLVRAQSEFLDAVHRARDIANDHLVVAVSPLFAEMLLGPLLVAYRARRPNTTIELRMTHDEEPLVDNGIDIAIRRGRPGNSTTLLRRRLGKTTLIVVGAPKWALANDESREALLDLPWIRVGSTIAPMEVPWSGRHIVVHPVVAADSQRLA
ncbi:MAG: LysR family transcriptional regulator, partial [Myxococcota bacterium]